MGMILMRFVPEHLIPLIWSFLSKQFDYCGMEVIVIRFVPHLHITKIKCFGTNPITIRFFLDGLDCDEICSGTFKSCEIELSFRTI
jgi:hypothetical protein